MKKILIIEDDEFLGSVINEKLKAEGFDAVWVKDGALGLKKIEELHPDLVLLDMMLPTLDGYEILEAKIKNEAIKPIPVIVISNSGQEVEIERIKALGIKDYIIKVQFSPKEVIDKVKQQLGLEVPVLVSDGKKVTKLDGIKILVVEDDDFLGDILSRKLGKEKADFCHVLSGEDALEKLKTWKPDIITLDVVLPGMSGFETLEKIRMQPTLENIPVLILSNLSQKEDEERSVKLGAKEYLVKSLYTLEEITEKIKAALSNK